MTNDTLQNGEFYNHWKLATVTPLLKKMGLPLEPSNYRPVSNLAFVSKLVEKCSIRQFNEHLVKEHLHSAHQSSYKENHSTETALCFLMNNLLWSMEEGAVSIMVALDLSAAFDTVDHCILASVLHHNFGCIGTALQWMKAYLENRQLQVAVDKFSSTNRTFNYSVPQGSCLGPVLFNVYSSTITDCLGQEQDLGGYADDHYLWDSFDPLADTAEDQCVQRI